MTKIPRLERRKKTVHNHPYDENSAPGQMDTGKPSTSEAHFAQGVSGAEPPLEQEGARHVKRHETAAGLTSVYETARYGLGQMGASRSVRTLRKVNQKDGFDCPSCAWPDPDGERKVAEFCENGAKAVASEATKLRANPEFFATHGIQEMLQKSLLWLDALPRLSRERVRRGRGDGYGRARLREDFRRLP